MEIGLACKLIIKCLDCGGEDRIDMGSLDEECDGCEILESSETVVNYYDSDFDYYEEKGIRQQVCV